MKITKSYLKQVIKEEISILKEAQDYSAASEVIHFLRSEMKKIEESDFDFAKNPPLLATYNSIDNMITTLDKIRGTLTP